MIKYFVQDTLIGGVRFPLKLTGIFINRQPYGFKRFPCIPPSLLLPPRRTGCPRSDWLQVYELPVEEQLLWCVIVETEPYSQEEPGACNGYRRMSHRNETLFGEPGRFFYL